MNPEDIKNIVSQVLEFIRTSGEVLLSNGFKIAYRKAIADGIVDTGFGLVCLFVLVYSLVKMIRLFRRSDLTDEDGLVFTALLIVFLASLFIMSLVLPDGIKHLIAPEWYAVTNMIGLFK